MLTFNAGDNGRESPCVGERSNGNVDSRSRRSNLEKVSIIHAKGKECKVLTDFNLVVKSVEAFAPVVDL